MSRPLRSSTLHHNTADHNRGKAAARTRDMVERAVRYLGLGSGSVRPRRLTGCRAIVIIGSRRACVAEPAAENGDAEPRVLFRERSSRSISACEVIASAGVGHGARVLGR